MLHADTSEAHLLSVPGRRGGAVGDYHLHHKLEQRRTSNLIDVIIEHYPLHGTIIVPVSRVSRTRTALGRIALSLDHARRLESAPTVRSQTAIFLSHRHHPLTDHRRHGNIRGYGSQPARFVSRFHLVWVIGQARARSLRPGRAITRQLTGAGSPLVYWVCWW